MYSRMASSVSRLAVFSRTRLIARVFAQASIPRRDSAMPVAFSHLSICSIATATRFDSVIHPPRPPCDSHRIKAWAASVLSYVLTGVRTIVKTNDLTAVHEAAIFGSLDNGETQMRYQKNIVFDTHSGGWIVEHRWPGGRWETVGVYGTRDAAMAVYGKL